MSSNVSGAFEMFEMFKMDENDQTGTSVMKAQRCCVGRAAAYEIQQYHKDSI